MQYGGETMRLSITPISQDFASSNLGEYFSSLEEIAALLGFPSIFARFLVKTIIGEPM
jgi:hypothetical protein